MASDSRRSSLLRGPPCASSCFPSPSQFHKPRLQWSTLFFLLAFLVCQTMALSPHLAQPTETLVMDTRIPVQTNGAWIMAPRKGLRRRDDSEPSEILPDSVTTAFETATSTVADATTTSAAESSPLPSPLDSNLSTNFTRTDGVATCPNFINKFLTDATFKECYPFSLLLQGSQSFFNAEKSLVSITQTLDASCSANATKCATYMGNLAQNLTLTANCGADYKLGNPVVTQAYIAMVAYQAVYTAACLKDLSTSQYCYADAITNLTTPSNVYFYYLPLNITLPGSTIPTCGSCLQQTMNVFQIASANRDQPIAYTYVSAAQQVNTICGPGFVNESLPLALVIKASAAPSMTPSWLLLGLSVLAVLQWLA